MADGPIASQLKQAGCLYGVEHADIGGDQKEVTAYQCQDGRIFPVVGVDDIMSSFSQGPLPGTMCPTAKDLRELADKIDAAVQQVEIMSLSGSDSEDVQPMESAVFKGDESRFKGFEWVTRDGVKLDEEQINAVKLILTTDANIIVLTGQAGSGKSEVVNFLRENNLLTVTAMTGKAALQVGGCTADLMFSFRRDTWQINWNFAEKNMHSSHSIIGIDEGSMTGNLCIGAVMTVAERYRKKVLLIGDWAQAKPVKDGWIFESDWFKDVCYIKLNKCHRQSEGKFIELLNLLRRGKTNSEMDEFFTKRIAPCPDETSDSIRCMATNRETERVNRRLFDGHLRRSRGKCGGLELTVDTDFTPSVGRTYNEVFKRNAIDSSPLAHNEQFSIGSRVLITVNDTSDQKKREYVNGDTGTIYDIMVLVPKAILPKESLSSEDFEGSLDKNIMLSVREHHEILATMPTMPRNVVQSFKIELDRGTTVIIAKMKQEKQTPQGRSQYVISGFPMRLGYAFTAHKSQGMTVDKIWVDADSFAAIPAEARHGLMYVAISRVRTAEGLTMSAWRPDLVYCDPAVKHMI